jgi:hypothetical protein
MMVLWTPVEIAYIVEAFFYQWKLHHYSTKVIPTTFPEAQGTVMEGNPACC